ncbi:MAG TPA: hypothetical protein VKZ92_02095 [Pseudohongiella sp.]|nr:hypothetical protein [Pseudohongiella sp.]
MSSTHTDFEQDMKFRRRLAVAISTAFGGALLVFLAVVMPAEFDRDPLGIGSLLGLKGMMNSNAGALNQQYEVHKSDEVEFILEPFQSLEYKYMMDLGNTLVFSWQADGELYYDLHAENFTVPDGEASFAQGSAAQQMGAYEALFNGMHGWFWENRTFETVTLRLKASGFFVSARIYGPRGTTDREPSPVF